MLPSHPSTNKAGLTSVHYQHVSILCSQGYWTQHTLPGQPSTNIRTHAHGLAHVHCNSVHACAWAGAYTLQQRTRMLMGWQTYTATMHTHTYVHVHCTRLLHTAIVHTHTYMCTAHCSTAHTHVHCTRLLHTAIAHTHTYMCTAHCSTAHTHVHCTRYCTLQQHTRTHALHMYSAHVYCKNGV